MTSIACVIITYNRSDFLPVCIDSLVRERNENFKIDVVVIDNGSSDDNEIIIRKYEDIRFIKKPVNMPLPLVLNEGLREGLSFDADYIVLLNDDIEMQSGALRELVEVCEDSPRSIVTPLQVNYKNPDHLDPMMLAQIKCLDQLVEDAVYRKNMKRSYEMPTLIGSALLARRDTYLDIGDFDTLFSFYGIDDDYCNRAKYFNYKLLLAIDAHMNHAHERVNIARKDDKAAWFRRWKSMYLARILFLLKDPHGSLIKNHVKALWLVFSSAVKQSLTGFPKGALTGIGLYLALVVKHRAVSRRRSEDYRI